MTTYSINSDGQLEIDFHGVKPDYNTRNKMKAVKIWWNPDKKVWFGPQNDATLAVASELCGGTVSMTSPVKRYIRKDPPKDYALKVKIKDIVTADQAQLETWEMELRDYVNEVMGEDNATHSGNAVSKSQESVWMNCFKFIAKHLSALSPEKQEFELVFEYSLPGTVHKRPDFFFSLQARLYRWNLRKRAHLK